MKHFLVAILCIVSFSLCAQRPQKEHVIGRLKLPEGLAAELTYKIYSVIDTTFYFTFKDMSAKGRDHFTTIRFSRSADIESLYTLVLKALHGSRKRSPSIYYVGSNEIGLKRSGRAGVRLFSGTSYIDLSGSQVNSLFGKSTE